MDEKRKRPRSVDRKQQILNETIELIKSSGLSGATMTRIAEKVGISEPALYRHFKNRKEIMLASLDAAFIKIVQDLNFGEADGAAFLRKVADVVYREFSRDPQSSRVLFEFLCAPPSEELREPIVNYLLMFLKLIEYRLGEAVQRGSFREDLDLQLTAWESFSLGFTYSFVSLMGLQEMLPEEKGRHAIENIIDRISAPPKPKRAQRKPTQTTKPRTSSRNR